MQFFRTIVTDEAQHGRVPLNGLSPNAKITSGEASVHALNCGTLYTRLAPPYEGIWSEYPPEVAAAKQIYIRNIECNRFPFCSAAKLGVN